VFLNEAGVFDLELLLRVMASTPPGVVSHVALQRHGQVDEIASFVAFLAGPEASYVTGASLLADGAYAA